MIPEDFPEQVVATAGKLCGFGKVCSLGSP
jgi:hypothetical protein